MKWLRKLFKTGEYDLTKYKKTDINYTKQVLKKLYGNDMIKVTMAAPQPPSISKVFTTHDGQGMYYAYWDTMGTLCIYRPEGLNNSKL